MGEDEILLSNVTSSVLILHSSSKYCFKEITKYFETLKTASVGHVELPL